jgi:hypothetical protein
LKPHAEENGEKKKNKYVWAKYNIYQQQMNPKINFKTNYNNKSHHKINVYKYKLRIKQLLLKQVSNVDDFLFAFLVVSVFVLFIFYRDVSYTFLMCV